MKIPFELKVTLSVLAYCWTMVFIGTLCYYNIVPDQPTWPGHKMGGWAFLNFITWLVMCVVGVGTGIFYYEANKKGRNS